MKKIPFLYTLIRGGIGKRFVIKHYGKRIIMTKFPDMSNIHPSKKQLHCRQLFAAAVAYAKKINNVPQLKKEYLATVKEGQTVYRAAIQQYMLLHKTAACNEIKTIVGNQLAVVKTAKEPAVIAPVITQKVRPCFIPVFSIIIPNRTG